MAHGSNGDWQQGQDALRDEVGRVTALLRSIRDPGPHAVGQWNLGEVAMHLSQAWIAVPGLARRDLSRVHEVAPSLAGVAGDSLIRDIWDLADTTTLGVKSDPERDPAVLADRIETRAQEYLSDCVGADPDAPRPWLVEGATVRQSTLTYHLLSETVMHGYDIAHAAGRPWWIELGHAAMVLARFNVPIAQALGPQVFVNGSKNRRPVELTAISRLTPSRCSWCSGTGRVNGRRSPRARCSRGAANRGWAPSSGASCATPSHSRGGVPCPGGRVSFLPPATLEVLRVVAVLGREFSVAELSMITGRSAVALLPELDGALRAGLLADASMGLAFRHELMREAIYHDVTPVLRQGLEGGRGPCSWQPALRVGRGLPVRLRKPRLPLVVTGR